MHQQARRHICRAGLAAGVTVQQRSRRIQVNQLYTTVAAHDIQWLHVSMHHTIAMHMLQGLCHLIADLADDIE